MVFPSDHVLLASCVACIVFLFNKTWLWLLVLLIAIGRVYVGVHHPIGVLGSVLITVVVTAIIRLAFSKVLREEDG